MDWYKTSVPEDELQHAGIQGMKWGVRRFQNEDGTWTEAGKKRYGDASTNSGTPRSRKRTGSIGKGSEIVKQDDKGPGRVAMAPPKGADDREWATVNSTPSDSEYQQYKKAFDVKDWINVYHPTLRQYIYIRREDLPSYILDLSKKGIDPVITNRVAAFDDSKEMDENRKRNAEITYWNEQVEKVLANPDGYNKFVEKPTENSEGLLTNEDKKALRELAKDAKSEKEVKEAQKKKNKLEANRNKTAEVKHSDDELQHYGILGMKWGVRRYQNPDGTLTEAGRRRLDQKDAKWAKKNYNKIYNSTYKDSRKEFNDFVKNELNKKLNPRLKSGRISYEYVNAYNQKLAEIMNKNVKDISAPSGKVVKWVAKRGDVGVHLALADPGYDLGKVKRGVYGTGRIAYKKDSVNTA